MPSEVNQTWLKLMVGEVVCVCVCVCTTAYSVAPSNEYVIGLLNIDVDAQRSVLLSVLLRKKKKRFIVGSSHCTDSWLVKVLKISDCCMLL